MKGMSLTKYSLLKLEFFSWKVTVPISLQRKATLRVAQSFNFLKPASPFLGSVI